MAQRRHHYEAAFEEYLRANQLPYLAVNEAKRALLPEGARSKLQTVDGGDEVGIKNFDFLVTDQDRHLIIDVKGRKIPRRKKATARGGRLESWVTRDDLASLAVWEELLGEGYAAWFVFMYLCEDQPADGLFQEVFSHSGSWYALRSIDARTYSKHMTVRSTRWRTVHLSTEAYERLSVPFFRPAAAS
ncbi:MAG: HYExAFE family protein [Planctomycetota bacterium]